ncbi:hypothetical protein [Blautia sp.]|uniref:hypothetical protein n=1 Tax=Blautia sp. TaxID=1955243 RepID=UPI003AB880FC
MDEKKVREAIEAVKCFPEWNKDDRWMDPQIMEDLVDTIIEALEKQLPKKVEMRTVYNDFDGCLICYKGFCPSCGGAVESYGNKSCHNCTQMLDWSE